MIQDRNLRNGLRRRSGVLVGTGIGGMLVAALAQSATAPVAAADAIENSLVDTVAAANAAFADASAAFGSSDVADGLGYSFAGLDDYLLATPADVAFNGYRELFLGYTGAGNFFTFPEVLAPTDLASTTADVTTTFETAESLFATAAVDFGSADYVDGAGNAFDGLGYLVQVPEVELIGMTDILLGAP